MIPVVRQIILFQIFLREAAIQINQPLSLAALQTENTIVCLTDTFAKKIGGK